MIVRSWPHFLCRDNDLTEKSRPIPAGRGVAFVSPTTPQSRLFAD